MLTHDFKSNTVFSDKISTNMDSNRHCIRRVIPHKEAEFSSQSIMKTMEKFVQAVQEMDETILVPSRLMDLRVGDDGEKMGAESSGGKRGGGGDGGSNNEGLSSTDLYRLYTTVNCVKNELLWGGGGGGGCGESTPTSSLPAPAEASLKTHARRPSTASVASTNSAVMSDTDSEAGNENDSGVETESDAPGKPSYVQTVEESFRRHLRGLHRSLEQMTRAASYLTERYQKEAGV